MDSSRHPELGYIAVPEAGESAGLLVTARFGEVVVPRVRAQVAGRRSSSHTALSVKEAIE